MVHGDALGSKIEQQESSLDVVDYPVGHPGKGVMLLLMAVMDQWKRLLGVRFRGVAVELAIGHSLRGADGVGTENAANHVAVLMEEGSGRIGPSGPRKHLNEWMSCWEGVIALGYIRLV